MPAFSFVTFLPLLASTLPVPFWIGEAREDMLTSSFLCLAGAAFFLFFVLPLFFYEKSFAGTDTRILALADNYRAWTQLQAMNRVEKGLTQH